jgi:hypothetical protein
MNKFFKILIATLFAIVLVLDVSYVTPRVQALISNGGGLTDSSGNLKITQATTQAGEDITNDVQKVEQRFSYQVLTADTLVKTGAGFIHTITCSQNDAAPTAGSIIAYDNTAESGTQIFNNTLTTAVFNPWTVTVDSSFSTGLYVGYTTTADVNCTVRYR